MSLPTLISVAVTRTMTKGNLEREGFTWLTLCNHSMSLGKVKARTQSRNLEAEIELEVKEESCLILMAFSASLLT